MPATSRALGAVRGVADWIGHALGDLVNTLNPQRVILGGSLASVLEIARPEVEQALEHYAFDAGHPVELVVPRFGERLSAAGRRRARLRRAARGPVRRASRPLTPG